LIHSSAEELEQLEIELLLEALYRRYGYDFRDYFYESARRRILRRIQRNQLKSVAALQHAMLHDETVADELLKDLSINVTEMFRDAGFYQTLREQVLPQLSTEEHLKIWHAGCSSGEEVYSMAILLTELELYSYSRLYATDFNVAILERAMEGICPLGEMSRNISNYQSAGGRGDFSDYYHARYEHAVMSNGLKKNIVFSEHDLAVHDSFGEMNMIVCRNVMIYFNQNLKDRVFQLFSESLNEGGILCLGSHESLQSNVLNQHFEPLHSEQRIYRKIG
jgi:chemotaxis protein methyltransferase CheR